MRITRIALTDFKRHDRLDIEPAAGLTIVRGPNEAGKSTLQQALELALFRKADANREDIRQAQRWGSTAPPVVELEFEVDGKACRLIKRFAGARGEAELTIDGQAVRDFTLIGEQIAAFTGIPTEAFFRATASVGHAELAHVGADEPLIGDRLQKAISGADQGTAKAKKKLDAAIHRYRTEGHKNPGLLKVVREEVAMLESEAATGEQALARLEADRAQWVEAHERREQLDVQLTRQQADLAEARRAESIAERRDVAQDRYDRLKRATELVDKGNELSAELPAAVPLTQLRSGVQRARNLRYELDELEADIGVDADAAAADDALRPPRPAAWLALAAGLIVVAWLGWSLVGGLIGAAVIVILTVVAIVALIQALRMALRRRRYGLALDLARKAKAERQAADREHQELFRRKRRELEGTLSAIGMPDLETAEEVLATAEEHTEELARIEGELRGLGIEERSVRRLEEVRDEAASEVEQARHALAGMGKLAEDPAASRQAAQRLVEQTGPARDEARSEEDQAQGRVDANQVDAELVAGLAERLAAARAREAELERRLLIYQGTRQAIESAELATLKTAARYLEERMGPAIERITDGRYAEVEVDETDLAFKARAPETGELLDVERLSQGTADQLFLTARLGLVGLVTMERRPPLILDDPFVTFDGVRAGRALRLVKQVAAERGFQVFYLTSSERFDALADELVVLTAPASEPLVTAGAPTPRFEPDPRADPVVDAPRVAEAHDDKPASFGLDGGGGSEAQG